jgi:arsenate reductase|tara:strand:- start:282 stop:563 length:282 start_codon:yes stop_codon:yes gene_type:complete
LLNEHKVDFVYREYTRNPLSVAELTELFTQLGKSPRELLRSRDVKRLELNPDQDDAALIAAMAEHPRLLQRPILVVGEKAVVGRPVENMLALL